MSKYTNAEKAAEAVREANKREEVYRRMRQGAPLTETDQRRIAIMKEIATEYRLLAAKDELL